MNNTNIIFIELAILLVYLVTPSILSTQVFAQHNHHHSYQNNFLQLFQTKINNNNNNNNNNNKIAGEQKLNKYNYCNIY
jgi:hypothetical protein